MAVLEVEQDHTNQRTTGRKGCHDRNRTQHLSVLHLIGAAKDVIGSQPWLMGTIGPSDVIPPSIMPANSWNRTGGNKAENKTNRTGNYGP